MTLEELKAMKEKSDNLCQTLVRDREILQEEKKRIDREVSNNLEKFLQEIKEIANLFPFTKGIGFAKDLSDGTNYQFLYCTSYTRIFFTKKEYGTLAITYIDEAWKIRVTERKSSLCDNSLEDILMPIFLQNKESILSDISSLVASSIEQSLQEEKKKNDTLYENIQKTKAVLK